MFVGEAKWNKSIVVKEYCKLGISRATLYNVLKTMSNLVIPIKNQGQGGCHRKTNAKQIRRVLFKTKPDPTLKKVASKINLHVSTVSDIKRRDIAFTQGTQ